MDVAWEDRVCQECGRQLRGTKDERAYDEDGLTLCQRCIDRIERSQ